MRADILPAGRGCWVDAVVTSAAREGVSSRRAGLLLLSQPCFAEVPWRSNRNVPLFNFLLSLPLSSPLRRSTAEFN